MNLQHPTEDQIATLTRMARELPSTDIANAPLRHPGARPTDGWRYRVATGDSGDSGVADDGEKDAERGGEVIVSRKVMTDLEGGAFGGIERTVEIFTVEMSRRDAQILLDKVLPSHIDPLTGVSAIRSDLQKLLATPEKPRDICSTCGGHGRIVRFEPWKNPIELCDACQGTGAAPKNTKPLCTDCLSTDRDQGGEIIHKRGCSTEVYYRASR